MTKQNAPEAGSESSARLGAVKLCLFCRHCEFEEAFAYSELTWQSGSINCKKGMNDYCSSDREDFAKWSRKAETCDAYDPDK